MKLTFNEHSERIHEVFEEENKYMTFSKLCVDTVKGKVVGYSVEEIVHKLDGVTNTQVDKTGTTLPLIECITSGVLRGAAVYRVLLRQKGREGLQGLIFPLA